LLTQTMIGVAILIARLPHRLRLILGSGLGRLSGWLLPRRRRIALLNIQACFPGLNPQQQKALVKANLISTGIGIMETLAAIWAKDRSLKSLADVSGTEHLEQALVSGKGAILLIGHFTCIELMCRLLNMHSPHTAAMLARYNNNQKLEAAINNGRRHHAKMVIEKKDLRKVRKTLKKNIPILYSPDQNFTSQSVFAEFFNIPAATLTATAELAKASQAAVLTIAFWRDRQNRYQIQIEPAWQDYPSGNPEHDARRYNQWLEDRIKKHPEQYLWVHRRFKTLPEGYPPIYPIKSLRKKHR